MTFDLEKEFNPDEQRDDHGMWTAGGDASRLTSDAISGRNAAFAAKYGNDVTAEKDRLAGDWYSMRPTSHLDSYLKGTLPAGAERTAWDAIHADTQARLAQAQDNLDLYRGIPGKEIADAVNAARASGADEVEIPIHDSKNHTHEAVCTTGEEDLAAAYAATRWMRHGGDPDAAHTGIVLHMRVPKSDVVFSTAYSAFTNPYTKNWDEYVVRTGGVPSLKIPLDSVKVVTR